jgi:Ca-activated chloride channel family protein
VGRIAAAALTLLAAWCLAAAQEPTFRVDVRLVRMLVTVRDAMGEPVRELTREDFKVTDNGVPQELAVFERHTDQPLSVALLIDSSASTLGQGQYVRNAVRRFLGAVTAEGNPADAVAAYAFNDEVTELTGFTRRADRLTERMAKIKPQGGTALYDAIYLASEDLGRREGRRVMVVLSDGGDTVSRVRFHGALEALHGINAVCYAILVVPVAAEAGRNTGGENALITLSTWTGGKLFFPADPASLEQALSDILKDLRTQYLLGYYPKNLPYTKERFHKVQVRVANPQYNISARNGYFSDDIGGGPAPARGPRREP